MADFYSNPAEKNAFYHMQNEREVLWNGNVQEKATVQKARQLHAEEKEVSALNNKAARTPVLPQEH